MPTKFYKIGLTGGIGCGKSEVRRHIEKLGFATIDADSRAKKIAVEDPRAISKIKKDFSSDVYSASGVLQRDVLAGFVFGNAVALQKLNAILHPLVFESVGREIEKLKAKKRYLIIIEAALFYESGWDEQMDIMVVVTAPMKKRKEWLQQRDGVTSEQINARMKHQIPVEDKARRADYLIENNTTLDALHFEISKFIDWLRSRILIQKPSKNI